MARSFDGSPLVYDSSAIALTVNGVKDKNPKTPTDQKRKAYAPVPAVLRVIPVRIRIDVTWSVTWSLPFASRRVEQSHIVRRSDQTSICLGVLVIGSCRGLGLGHFELGRTYIRLERFEDALTHARRAVEFMPDHQSARQMLTDLERALGG